jgi:hypothetical protein
MLQEDDVERVTTLLEQNDWDQNRAATAYFN